MKKLTPNEILKKHWGYQEFRPLQAKIISHILEKNNTLVLMGTGAGKSICYQIPALIHEGITLVISPLLSLMKDQITQLKNVGITAAVLSSEVHASEVSAIFDNLKFGKYKLLYISPERILNKNFLQRIQQINVSMIAIDEAHCISEWGHDFRPSYREIYRLRGVFPQASIAALTATATKKVRKDILESLQIQEAKTFISSFKKSNLSYNVLESYNKEKTLMDHLNHHKGSGIVFIQNRKEVERVSNLITQNGFDSNFYHAKLSPIEKNKRQEQWKKSDSQIMVATSAFGMGIDKPDVRTIIHFNIPSSIESYFQEAGRAGRDGKDSQSYIFYNPEEISRVERFFHTRIPSKKEFHHIIKMFYNHFQVAENELPETKFIFNLKEFVKKFHLDTHKTKSVIHFLHTTGVIYIQKHEQNSLLKINIASSEISKINSSLHRQILTELFRSHENISNQEIPIDEYLLSRKIKLRTSHLTENLETLSKQQLVSYTSKRGEKVSFLEERSSKRLGILWKNFEASQQRQWKKLSEMIFFVKTESECREKLLLKYFGESIKEKCGKCDYCIKHSTTDQKAFTSMIFSCLSQKPKSISAICSEFTSIPKEMIGEILQSLTEQGKIKQSNFDSFHL